MHAVVARDGALAGVVRKAAHVSAFVQRRDGVGRQRAKAHGRDVEDACLIRLGAGRGRVGPRHATYPEPKVSACQLGGLGRVVDPLIAARAHIQVGAKGLGVGRALGALVHQRALRAREGRCLAVAFNKILSDLWPNELHQKAKVSNHGVIARDGVVALLQVQHASERQQASA